MVATSDRGWEGQERPTHRRYFTGQPQDNFVVDISDEKARLSQDNSKEITKLFTTKGTITRVSSYQDVLGDGRYLEFSDKDFVTFKGSSGAEYIFYKNLDSYLRHNQEEESPFHKINSTENWFNRQGLEGTL
jgi:hypothetical protein